MRNRRKTLIGVAAGLLLCGGLAATVAQLYRTTPQGDAGSGPVDALLVLGSPAELDGSLTPVQRWRTDEAVREFRAGRAPHLVFTGGPTVGGHVESQVMGAYAMRQGVPPGAIAEETRSFTTLQNLHNTLPYLKQHGWTRVEVISTPEHLHRVAVLLRGSGLQWRLHAAATPGRPSSDHWHAAVEEAFGTAVLRVFGTRAEPLLHGVAVVLHWTAFSFRWVRLWWSARVHGGSPGSLHLPGSPGSRLIGPPVH